MGEMHVPHVEARAFPGEASGAEGRQAPLVCELGQRVCLVHELGELRPAEELADGCHHGAYVDQTLGSGRFRVHQRHLFLDHALHAQQADADLVLDQFAHGSHSPVAQVVDIVNLALTLVYEDHRANDRNDVLAGQGLGIALLFRKVQAAIELVAADATQVVPSFLEEEIVDQVAGVLQARRLAGPEAPVELDLGARDTLGRLLVELLTLVQPVPERQEVLLAE